MAYGFTFGGVHSDAFDLIINKKNVPITPPIQSRTQEISGFDGAWDYGVSYGAREIEIECTMFGESKEDLKNNIRKLASVLNPRKGAKPLVFDDEPDKQYFARLSNQIPLDQLGSMGTFTLQFVCPDPFTYATELRTGNFGNDIAITHEGTHESKPILTVTHGGGKGAITLTRADDIVETLEFTDESESGTYRIDCKEMTITKDGAAAYHFVSGDFFSMPEGRNSFVNTGNISKVSIEFRDTWL